MAVFRLEVAKFDVFESGMDPSVKRVSPIRPPQHRLYRIPKFGIIGASGTNFRDNAGFPLPDQAGQTGRFSTTNIQLR